MARRPWIFTRAGDFMHILCSDGTLNLNIEIFEWCKHFKEGSEKSNSVMVCS